MDGLNLLRCNMETLKAHAHTQPFGDYRWKGSDWTGGWRAKGRRLANFPFFFPTFRIVDMVRTQIFLINLSLNLNGRDGSITVSPWPKFAHNTHTLRRRSSCSSLTRTNWALDTKCFLWPVKLIDIDENIDRKEKVNSFLRPSAVLTSRVKVSVGRRPRNEQLDPAVLASYNHFCYFVS